MALVDVPGGGLPAEGVDDPGAAHPEDDLLAEAHLPAPHVEDVGDGPVGRVVGGQVGVEQQQRHPAHVDAPDADVHHAPGQFHLDDQGVAGAVEHPAQGPAGDLHGAVVVLLGALGVHLLVEVAQAVEEADGHHRARPGPRPPWRGRRRARRGRRRRRAGCGAPRTRCRGRPGRGAGRRGGGGSTRCPRPPCTGRRSPRPRGTGRRRSRCPPGTPTRRRARPGACSGGSGCAASGAGSPAATARGPGGATPTTCCRPGPRAVRRPGGGAPWCRGPPGWPGGVRGASIIDLGSGTEATAYPPRNGHPNRNGRPI